MIDDAPEDAAPTIIAADLFLATSPASAYEAWSSSVTPVDRQQTRRVGADRIPTEQTSHPMGFGSP
ncbi:MAG: hypothetical protein JO114_11495 [Planctomycetaceae bacterium]|nr:hypothetical protein [Planctomycetaceae bacterium]